MVDIHSEEYILGQNIRKYRLRLGWSQADLSNAVDIDRADISKYENGAKGIMSSTLLRKFAKGRHCRKGENASRDQTGTGSGYLRFGARHQGRDVYGVQKGIR